MRVLDRYPHCPVIWMCHDSRNWWDQPPTARIHRYVAIDRTRRDYLTRVMVVPDDRVDVLYNAVDLGRIPLRPSALPARPRRALAYTKTRGQIGVLRAACERAGMALATMGRGIGREIANPEDEIVHYDLVFATGRSAIDAL